MKDSTFESLECMVFTQVESMFSLVGGKVQPDDEWAPVIETPRDSFFLSVYCTYKPRLPFPTGQYLPI